MPDDIPFCNVIQIWHRADTGFVVTLPDAIDCTRLIHKPNPGAVLKLQYWHWQRIQVCDWLSIRILQLHAVASTLQHPVRKQPIEDVFQRHITPPLLILSDIISTPLCKEPNLHHRQWIRWPHFLTIWCHQYNLLHILLLLFAQRTNTANHIYHLAEITVKLPVIQSRSAHP